MRITPVLLAWASLTATQPTKPAPLPSPSASVSVFFQLSINPSWFENLAVRPDGQIIATRVDVPEVWLIDPVRHTGNLLVTVPGVSSAIGIAQVRPDVYVFAGGNFTVATKTIVPQSAKVFELDMTCSPPTVKLLKALPQAGLLNGVCKLGPDTVLIAEYALGGVYRLNTKTGEVATVLDATQAPNANGVHVFHHQLYFSSTANQTLFKVPINANGEPTGPITTVYNRSVIDDFIVEPDGTVYLAANAINEIVRVNPDGTSSVLVGSPDSFEVAGVTAVALGPDFKGGKTLYATTSGGAVAPIHNTTEPAKIVEVKIFETCKG